MGLLRRSLCFSLPVSMLGTLGAAPLCAEKPPRDPTNWDNLKALAPDKDVRVALKNGELYQENVQLLTMDNWDSAPKVYEVTRTSVPARPGIRWRSS
jgi:hypothetical protein